MGNYGQTLGPTYLTSSTLFIPTDFSSTNDLGPQDPSQGKLATIIKATYPSLVTRRSSSHFPAPIYRSPTKNCALPIPKLQSSFSFPEQLTIRSSPPTPHSFCNLSASAAYSACFVLASLPCWKTWTKTSFSVRWKPRPVSSQMSS